MRRRLLAFALPMFVGTAVLVGTAAAQDSTMAHHGQMHHAGAQPALKWGPAPDVFPAGAKMAVVSGDPGQAVPFVVRLDLPAGYKIAPHFHPTDEVVTVVKGTFLVGMGDTFDAIKAKSMAAGEKGNVAANQHHFAKGECGRLQLCDPVH